MIATKPACAAGIAMLVAGVVAGPPAAHAATVAGEVTLTATLADTDLGGGTALIMGPGGSPEPGETYMASIDRLYLDPMGFTGDTVAVNVPWDTLLGNWDSRVAGETESLVAAVNAQWADGDYNADNPLVIVGYSESAVAAGQAMQQLYDQGDIPQDALHFVLIGDTASPLGGFLNAFLPSLPEGMQDFAKEILSWFGVTDLLGATTPTDLYQTDVFTIPGDMWGDWASISSTQEAMNGFFTHLGYIGLTSEQIEQAAYNTTEGLTNYYTIPAVDVDDPLAAIANALVNMGSIPDWLADLFN